MASSFRCFFCAPLLAWLFSVCGERLETLFIRGRRASPSVGIHKWLPQISAFLDTPSCNVRPLKCGCSISVAPPPSFSSAYVTALPFCDLLRNRSSFVFYPPYLPAIHHSPTCSLFLPYSKSWTPWIWGFNLKSSLWLVQHFPVISLKGNSVEFTLLQAIFSLQINDTRSEARASV